MKLRFLTIFSYLLLNDVTCFEKIFHQKTANYREISRKLASIQFNGTEAEIACQQLLVYAFANSGRHEWTGKSK